MRQVLQHLTNQQIEAALLNLEASGARCIIIAEDVFDGTRNSEPNEDLPHASVGTRSNFGSGVLLDRSPFNRQVELIESVREKNFGSQLVIYRLLFRLL
ncbi:MAG: hypothetical protein AAF192_00045 [Pseudomonadota bacterium]